MGVNFTATTLSNAVAPVTAEPFSVGMWVYPRILLTPEVIWMCGNSTASDGFYVGKSLTGGTELWVAGVFNASTPTNVTVTGKTNIKTWHYLLFRAVSSTNRWLSVLNPYDSSVTHAQDTTSKSPAATPTQQNIASGSNGTFEQYSGAVAEFFLANTDVYPSGGQPTDAFIRQLAYTGPFSMSSILRNDIIDYRSFKYSIDTASDGADGYFQGSRGLRQQIWTNTSGATNYHHPALRPEYRGPNDLVRTGLV